jgi:putative peptidoglycan lipid II flippase
LLASFALSSQLLALVRDRLLAHSFGAGSVLDIYYAAFRVPDFIYASVASVVSISVMIPFLASRLEDDKGEAKEFIDSIFSAFFWFISATSLAVFIFAPQIINMVYPGFAGTLAFYEIVFLTRIFLLSPILLGISNLLASITQTFRQFFVYALSPLLYNLGIIFGVLFLYPTLGLAGLGWGVVIGAFLHLLIQIPTIAKSGFVPSLRFRVNMSDIKSVALTSLPRTLALSANQLALLVLISLASFMAEGSISIFNFSFNIQSAPLSIIAVSYSLAAFPTLSRLYSSGKTRDFIDHIVSATRYIIFWSLPAIVLIIVLRAQIVRTVLGSGQFSWSDTRLTAAAVAIFVISLIGQGLNQLFIRGYYAAGNTLKPLVVNIISSVSIVLGAIIFTNLYHNFLGLRFFIESLLRVEDVPSTSVLVLPMAYSFGLILNGSLFWFLFQRDFKGFSSSLHRTFFHSLGAALIAGFSAYLGLAFLANIFDLNTLFGIFMQGLLAGLFGIAAGVLLLYSMGNEELEDIYIALRQRLWKEAETIIPESDEI